MQKQIFIFVMFLLVCSSALDPAFAQIICQIESKVDHNHCTTRQFQHKTFYNMGVWFVFYSDGKNFCYQTSDDSGKTWCRAKKPIDQAPNGSSGFDVLKINNLVYICHPYYPMGRYDVNAPYAKNPPQGEYLNEGRVKKGLIEGRTIHWLADVNPGFTPNYSNIVQDSNGYFWIFSRKYQQGVAYRSQRPNDIQEWLKESVCMQPKGRHAMDAVALSNGCLYVVSMVTTEGKLYGNFYDAHKWGQEAILISNDVTTVAGDDRRLSLEFDPTSQRLHLIYVDAKNTLRYRYLDAPYKNRNWKPDSSEAGFELSTNVFTCAMSVDTSQKPFGLVITYGIEKYVGEDKRERTGSLIARRFDGQKWQDDGLIVSQLNTRYNWYPSVNQDVSNGLCVMYSRSVDEPNIGSPLAVMVSVIRLK